MSAHPNGSQSQNPSQHPQGGPTVGGQMGGQTGGHPHHIHPPTYPPKLNTTMLTASTPAVVKRNTLAVAPGEPAAELLRQTLRSAPNSRPGSRSSSRRRTPTTPTTPRLGQHTIYTPNGSIDGSDGAMSPRAELGGIDFHRMRHGFEDEYNSEDYLAVLEQVCGHVPPMVVERCCVVINPPLTLAR